MPGLRARCAQRRLRPPFSCLAQADYTPGLAHGSSLGRSRADASPSGAGLRAPIGLTFQALLVNRTPVKQPFPGQAVQVNRVAAPGWLRAGVLAAVLATTATGVAAQASPTASAAPATPASAPSVRPEVGKPLQAAQDAAKAGNYNEALARVAEVEAMPGLTP